jgi:hypothetical protein
MRAAIIAAALLAGCAAPRPLTIRLDKKPLKCPEVASCETRVFDVDLAFHHCVCAPQQDAVARPAPVFLLGQ